MTNLKSDKDFKLYYSIGEVAKMFNLNDATLRYWEKEFSNIINPRKTNSGARLYKKEDIEDIRLIHHLLKEKKLTIAGAKQKLKENKGSVVKNEEIIHKLKGIKKELLHLKEAFDTLQPD
jgi:DNA-binding transcriptional MerR regulator